LLRRLACPQVQDALHAPHVEWDDCSNIDVYVGRDQSIPSTLSVLPNVIEKSERTLIVHGLIDYILIAEGTRIAIQCALSLRRFQSTC
jgi:carboxypeptidase D